MKVSFLSPSVSRTGGGIFEIVRSLALTLSSWPDTSLSVFGLNDDFTVADAGVWRPVSVHTYNRSVPYAFGYSPSLREAFLSHPADIAHLHALWMYSSIIIHEWGKRRGGRPYVTTLNGMLDPWALKNAFLKKKIAGVLYENRSLNHAGCIQVNSDAEFMAARLFGLRNPICVIPNGVSLPDLKKQIIVTAPHELEELKKGGRKVLLYLGRLHPKKGLYHLVTSLKSMRGSFDEWVLVIAGWDQLGHADELRQLVASLHLNDRVIFLGPQYDTAKESCFRCADAFILPSHSEGLPMAVLEAWAFGKPVLITPACNLQVGYEVGAAIPIEPDAGSIEEGLRHMFALPDVERNEMGKKGRILVEKRFSWHSAATELRSVYTWLLDGGAVPSCVRVD